MVFRANHVDLTHETIWSKKESLDIKEQFQVINSIPNFHKWPWEDKLVSILRFTQRLPASKSCYPGSPRHRIFHAIDKISKPGPVIYAIVGNISGESIPVYCSKPRKRRKVDFIINNF